MKIDKWVNIIYGDAPGVAESVQTSDVRSGKRIINFGGEVHEIDVVGPNVEDEDLAPYNVCPKGTIRVENACISDAKTKPYDGAKSKYGYADCGKGYVYGERTDELKALIKKKVPSQGMKTDSMDMNLELLERVDIEVTGLEMKTSGVCVKTEDMPLTEKNIQLVTDSIIGWGGYAEFPYWEMDWDMMNDLADRRYKHGAKMGGTAYVASFNEYPGYTVYLAFKDKEDAVNVQKSLKYYDDSSEFVDDTRKMLQETAEKGEEISDERVYNAMAEEKSQFFEDLDMSYDSYLGMASNDRNGVGYVRRADYGHDRDVAVLIVEKTKYNRDTKKHETTSTIVIPEEV
jgi:hypothetical protein